VVINQGRVLADAPVAELTNLAHRPSLEGVFAELVQQEDTRSIARQIVTAMQGSPTRPVLARWG
jgi:ABC-2 type transport system ATP-binding protein